MHPPEAMGEAEGFFFDKCYLSTGSNSKIVTPLSNFRKLAISQSKQKVVHFLGINVVDDSFSNNCFEICHSWSTI